MLKKIRLSVLSAVMSVATLFLNGATYVTSGGRVVFDENEVSEVGGALTQGALSLWDFVRMFGKYIVIVAVVVIAITFVVRLVSGGLHRNN